MKIVDVEHISKEFGDFTAVGNVSFSMMEGEILGLLGPNGAGKTTTIQMLLGVLTPSRGKIKYFGKDLYMHREEILEYINFSSTYINLPWRMRVWECLSFLSYLYSIENRKKRIEKIVATFKLEKLLDLEISQLSAGQTTRVNLAKAFLNYPKILLLDEPTASLDPDVAHYIRDFLKIERQKFSVSILFTSHNMAEVEEICDRVIFIDKGKIVADDTPANLARSIRVSHVKLMIRNGLKHAIEYARKHKIPYESDIRFITLDVDELKIPEFLASLTKRGVIYDEISINKPTLEDYFLQVSHVRK